MIYSCAINDIFGSRGEVVNSKRIAIIYTGGTIGMMPSEQGLVPEAGYLPKRLQQEPRLQSASVPDFDLIEYSPLLDSSDMEPADWHRLAKDISHRYSDFDGFLVLHGTDTLAYTASALSFLLPGMDKPGEQINPVQLLQ